MSSVQQKRRGVEVEERRPRKKPRIKRQFDYHSSSEDEEAVNPQLPQSLPKSILKQSARRTVPLEAETDVPDNRELVDELEQNTALNATADQRTDNADSNSNGSEEEADEDDESVDSDVGTSSMGSSSTAKTAKKRNDPDAFATSISKILGTKLSQPKRHDPILSRSLDSSRTTQSLADSKLEQRARGVLRAEKKLSLEKGRVKDVLALESTEKATGALLEEEKRLKKTAQRGVVRLFNAVRAAQVRAEEALRQAREEGLVGMQKREEKVNEMSKQGFLDLISKGGTAKASS